MTLQELRQKRQAAITQAEALSNVENLTPEQSAQFDALMAEVAECDNGVKALEEQAKAAAERKAKVAALNASGRKSPTNAADDITNVRDRVLDDPKRGFRNLGDFALELYNCGPSLAQAMNNPRLQAAAGTGMQQGVTADGGVLVPPAFSKEIWDGARQQSDSMLSYCDVMTVDAGVESVTIPASAETSRADGSRWGGIRGYWKSELTAMLESKPKLRDLTLRPNELYVFGYISEKLLRNAPGVASNYLATAAADEINFKIGDAVWNGDGAGKPLGFLTAPGTVSVSKETGQAATTIVSQNIWKMYSRLHGRWRSGAAWFINQDCEPQLQQLKIDVGTGGQPLYIPPGGIADSPNARILGLPVVVCEYAATLGTVGDIVLANLNAYAVGMRGMVDSAVSMHLKFDYAQQAFRWIFEMDGQPWLASAITPFKGSATQSPIVTLATRS